MKLILAMRQRKIDYHREAKRNRYRREAWIAVRRNEIDSCHEAKKIDYRREAKRKLISPWGVNRRQAEWNWFLPCGKEKSIIAVRQRENRYSREAWIAVRQNEIGSCREAKKNQLSPWGKEKIDITVRRRKNWLSPWGVNRRQAEWNWFLPWGKEKNR